jgi:ABC-type multidrug transport system fused ATPase/permease subunit
MTFLTVPLVADHPVAWLCAGALAIGGFALFRLTWPVSRQRGRPDCARATAMTAPALVLRHPKGFGATEIIRGVNLSVATCERHAVIGLNSAGKSTLFNLISGGCGRMSSRSPSRQRHPACRHG